MIPGLLELSAVQMARMVSRKEISPVELVQAHLEQINSLNPVLNAFVDLRAEAALDEAGKLEAAIMRGEQPGAMQGVPVSIKSCIDVAGVRCEAGSKLRSPNV